MNKPEVHIVHGYQAEASSHWFPWLKTRLLSLGVTTFIHHLPDSNNPDVECWMDYLRRNIHCFHEKTIFVGHSLGCITLLRYLSLFPRDFRITGLILVAGFDKPLPLFPELNSFISIVPDYPRIINSVQTRMVLVSDNDSIVPPELTEELSGRLHSSLIKIPHGGHFMAIDGFLEFPLILQQIKKSLNLTDD